MLFQRVLVIKSGASRVRSTKYEECAEILSLDGERDKVQ
jgi:hypothetical protein